jgi:DTW domain-containing protein YfiP
MAKSENAESPVFAPAEDDIRDYAYHLYVQNGHRNDRCADNWREARACLCANIPKQHSHSRLHRNLILTTHSRPSAIRDLPAVQ